MRTHPARGDAARPRRDARDRRSGASDSRCAASSARPSTARARTRSAHCCRTPERATRRWTSRCSFPATSTSSRRRSGIASVDAARAARLQVSFDPRQTCCGQPFVTTGALAEARRLARAARCGSSRAPRPSCVRRRAASRRCATATPSCSATPTRAPLAARTFELGEFLVRALGASDVGARFPHRVALLESCHGLRELGLGRPSERTARARGRSGIDRAPAARRRGARALRAAARATSAAASAARSRSSSRSSRRASGATSSRALAESGAEYVTGTDASCLLHLDGLRRARGRRSARRSTSPRSWPRGSARERGARPRARAELLPAGARLAAHDARRVRAAREARRRRPRGARLRAAARAGARGSRRTRSTTSTVYLERFEARARRRGRRRALGRGRAASCARIVHELLAARGARRVVKSKSMLTEECGLNPYLESARHRGGRHRPRRAHRAARRRAALAHHHAGDPPYARRHRRAVRARARRRPRARPIRRDSPRSRARDLRARFLGADAAITGANFAVAETRHARGRHQRGQRRPRHEPAAAARRLPGHREAGPDARPTSRCSCACSRAARRASRSRRTRAWSPDRGRARSSTSCWSTTGARACSPTPRHRSALGCIRCGACLNTCPVYRRAGGHAYGWALPGPDRRRCSRRRSRPIRRPRGCRSPRRCAGAAAPCVR